MNEQDVAYMYNGILLCSLKQEKNSDTSYSVNEPEDIMLNEISQSQKDKYCVILLTWGS